MADSPKVPLTDKPGVSNWVERTGALKPKGTNWIRRVAEHLKGKGMTEGHAIAIAVNAAKRMCSSGDTNFPGLQQVNAGSRAEACAAVAKWEAAKARAKADRNLSVVTAFAVIDLAKVHIRAGGKIGVRAPSAQQVHEHLGGETIDLADPQAVKSMTAADLVKSKRSQTQRGNRELRHLETKILYALRRRFPNRSDGQLRNAARRGAVQGLKRRRIRQALGVQNINQASPAEVRKLRAAGLLPGGKAGKGGLPPAGTVISHKLTRGPRKGQTVTIKVGRGGSWHEVKQDRKVSKAA